MVVTLTPPSVNSALHGRSATLLVPSVVARVERNVVIHPHHADAGSIAVGLETPVHWDSRLFAR